MSVQTHNSISKALKLPALTRSFPCSTSRRYQYQKLGTPSVIRLIQVLPELEDGRIVCEVRTVDPKSSDGLEYHALSYQWGDPKPTRQIYLRDLSSQEKYLRPLHENLWQFLCEIRRRSLNPGGHLITEQEISAPLLIWTDSLCLNQGDAEELKQQVPRMGKIYSQARTVLIWLGANPRIEVELRCLRDCGDNGRRSIFQALRKGYDHIKSSGTASPEEDEKKPISFLLMLEYWKRIWVVQEVVLASQACVMAGEVTMDFSILAMMTWGGGSRNGEGAGLARICSIISLRCSGGRRRPLQTMFTMLKGTTSTRPADAIYGLLGLVDADEDGQSSVEHIAVDYTKRPVDVLFDTVFETRQDYGGYGLFLESLDSSLRQHKTNKLTGPKSMIKHPLALETYLNGRTISNRHRRLAELALTVFKAMGFLSYTLSIRYARFWTAGVYDFLDECGIQRNRDEATVQQHAAVVGFLLAGYTDDLRVLKRRSWREGPSPWRCAAHWSRCQYPGTEPTELRAGDYCGDNLESVCGERGNSCDGSVLGFEIPEIGFCVVVSRDQEAVTISMFDA